MTPAEVLQIALSAGGGAVIVRLIDVTRDALSSAGRARRGEVDQLGARVKELTALNRTVQGEADGWRARYRKLTEEYHALRVWVILSGKFDPADVPDAQDIERR